MFCCKDVVISVKFASNRRLYRMVSSKWERRNSFCQQCDEVSIKRENNTNDLPKIKM